MFAVGAVCLAVGGASGCVTWWQVLAVAGGVDQDVGVEGGIEPFISAVERDGLSVSVHQRSPSVDHRFIKVTADHTHTFVLLYL